MPTMLASAIVPPPELKSESCLLYRIYAIDPGQTGAISWADFATNGRIGATPHLLSVGCKKISTLNNDQICSILTAKPGWISTAYIESPPKHIGGNVPESRAIVFGMNTGFIYGVAYSQLNSVKLVIPRTWMKALGLKRARAVSPYAWKQHLKEKAELLWKFTATKPNMQTADSLLILEYAIRQEWPGKWSAHQLNQ